MTLPPDLSVGLIMMSYLDLRLFIESLSRWSYWSTTRHLPRWRTGTWKPDKVGTGVPDMFRGGPKPVLMPCSFLETSTKTRARTKIAWWREAASQLAPWSWRCMIYAILRNGQRTTYWISACTARS